MRRKFISGKYRQESPVSSIAESQDGMGYKWKELHSFGWPDGAIGTSQQPSLVRKWLPSVRFWPSFAR
jgi:hypothetical protein